MKFENVRVYNFDGALRGMRNPKNSWHRSDSAFGICPCQEIKNIFNTFLEKWLDGKKLNDATYQSLYERLKSDIIIWTDEEQFCEYVAIGPNDMRLATDLTHSGPEHRKFLRQIFVSMDITAPLYWWKEFDTYKVATVANSASTMHKITSIPITLQSFETDDYHSVVNADGTDIIPSFIQYLEYLRKHYLELMKLGDVEQAKIVWKELIRWLPEGWLQRRTITCNYETLLSICSKSQRRYHKLTEWSFDTPTWEDDRESFIRMARSLPYARDFIFIDEDNSTRTLFQKENHNNNDTTN